MQEITDRRSQPSLEIELQPPSDEFSSTSSMEDKEVPLNFFKFSDPEESIKNRTIGQIVIRRKKVRYKSKSETKLSKRINLDPDTLDTYFSKLNIDDKLSKFEPRRVKIQKDSGHNCIQKIQKENRRIKRTQTAKKTDQTASKLGVKKKGKMSSSSSKKNKQRAQSFRELKDIGTNDNSTKKESLIERKRCKSSKDLPRIQLESDLIKRHFITEEQSTSSKKLKQEKTFNNSISRKKANQKNRVRSRSRDSRYSNNISKARTRNKDKKLERNPYKFHTNEIIEIYEIEKRYTIEGDSNKEKVQGYLYEGNLHCLKYSPMSGTIYSTAIAIFLANQGISLSMKDILMEQEEQLSMTPYHLKDKYSVESLLKPVRGISKLRQLVLDHGSALVILDNKGYPHPIFIDEINDDTVLVRDPGDGKRKLITMAALKNRWQRTLALFQN